MSAYHDRLELERKIKELVDTYQSQHDLRVTEINVADNGWTCGRPAPSTISIEAEEQF